MVGALESRLGRMLSRKRLRYAWIVGAALWLTWLASIALGRGDLDVTGTVVGTDYLQFYSAGYTLRLDQSARLYDMAFQSALQQRLIGPALRSYYAFINPPFLAAEFAPLSALSYRLSFAVWSALGLAGLWLGLRWLDADNPWVALGWALTWFPIFTSISYGQNGLLSLALCCLTYRLWRRRRLWAAGLTCSALMYKPQLVFGVALLWLLEWRRDWRALAGLAAGSVALAALCFGCWPDASRAYVKLALTVLPDLPAWKQFPLWHLHTVRGFWRLLLPGRSGWADALTALFSLAGVLVFLRLWRRLRLQAALLFAAAIALTLWLTPHAMIYDWSLLLIPAVLLWQQLPGLRERWQLLFAAVWLATLVGSSLTAMQLRALPVAVQVSVPVLGVALYYAQAWMSQAGPQEDHALALDNA